MAVPRGAPTGTESFSAEAVCGPAHALRFTRRALTPARPAVEIMMALEEQFEITLDEEGA